MKTTLNILFLASLTTLMASCSGESTDNAQLEADISPVIPKVNSTVVAIKVNDNQVVKKGDTLLILDTATFSIAVTRSRIALMEAKKSVNLAANNKGTADINVSNVTASSGALSVTLASSNANVESARARMQVADKNFERYRQLLDQKSATQQQFDQVKADQVDATAKLEFAIGQRDALIKQIQSGKLQIQNTQKQVANTKENITIAELSVQKAQADLDAAVLQLSYCTIVAPADGIVSKKNVQIGQVVAVGNPLMAIANNKKVWVIANFKETQLEHMRIGQEVEVDVDAYPDTTLKGKVESFAQATGAKFSFLPSDNATGNFVKVTQRIPVKIVIPESNSHNYPLRAGMSVYVKVKTK